jgi:hypothetical protein
MRPKAVVENLKSIRTRPLPSGGNAGEIGMRASL